MWTFAKEVLGGAKIQAIQRGYKGLSHDRGRGRDRGRGKGGKVGKEGRAARIRWGAAEVDSNDDGCSLLLRPCMQFCCTPGGGRGGGRAKGGAGWLMRRLQILTMCYACTCYMVLLSYKQLCYN